jgi:hypothetical protein
MWSISHPPYFPPDVTSEWQFPRNVARSPIYNFRTPAREHRPHGPGAAGQIQDLRRRLRLHHHRMNSCYLPSESE